MLMLYYLIAVNGGLLAAALLCGVLYGFADRSYDAFGRRWMHAGLIAGAAAAAVMAYLKNKTNVMLDVGDKVNQELKTYGANITVVPKSSAVLSDLYEVEGGEAAQGAYLREDELGNIKTIFWAFNIVDFAPFLDTEAELSDGTEVNMAGTWYNHYMALPTGETLTTGVQNLRTWWDITEGRWLNESEAADESGVMVGAALAGAQGLHAGDTLTVTGRHGSETLTVVGIFDAGDDADSRLFAPLHVVQKLSGLEGRIASIEVSAITTPDNELAVKAAKDPKSLSAAQYETWYCTAYVSSICFQIQEVITDAVASPVRQVADSEGAILEKTELLMLLITVLALVGSALGISNLVTASVMKRFTVCDFLLSVLALALLLGLLFVFGPCAPREDGGWMTCHWAGQALKGGLESILLQGIPGYFYMDDKAMTKIAAMDGVEVVSPQFFLATAKASCCSSYPIQLIGFDTATDFTIRPWVRRSYSGTMGEGDIIIGNHVTMPSDGVLTFYEQKMRVVAQLDETGTALDNAVYGSMETMRNIARNAEALGYRYLGKVSADKAVSALMIKVADGYSPEDVCNDINIHVRKVDATQAKSMVSQIAGGLSSVSRVIGTLTVLIWVLALLILSVAFVLIVGERKKEFAILRVVGASRRMLSAMLLTESAILCCLGAICGVGLAALTALCARGRGGRLLPHREGGRLLPKRSTRSTPPKGRS